MSTVMRQIRWRRHIQYADLSVDEFCKRARLHVEALNRAVAGIPVEQLRIHLCWGNYEGPHHCDVRLADVIDIALEAPKAAALLRANSGSQVVRPVAHQTVTRKLLMASRLSTPWAFIEPLRPSSGVLVLSAVRI